MLQECIADRLRRNCITISEMDRTNTMQTPHSVKELVCEIRAMASARIYIVQLFSLSN